MHLTTSASLPLTLITIYLWMPVSERCSRPCICRSMTMFPPAVRSTWPFGSICQVSFPLLPPDTSASVQRSSGRVRARASLCPRTNGFCVDMHLTRGARRERCSDAITSHALDSSFPVARRCFRLRSRAPELCSRFTNGIAGLSHVEDRDGGRSGLRRGGSDGRSEATGLWLNPPPPV